MSWIIRSNETSISDFGVYPGARPLAELKKNGVIILDKPSGPTSHQVDAWIKQILGVGKASHGGTLDPRVTGVMLIALENATKLMPVLLSCRKEYVALIHVHKDMPPADIRRALAEFVGENEQLPPKRSAVARRVRTRSVYYLDVLDISGRDVLVRVGCEAGTYIRRIADDLGKKIGCGSHLQELRRTRSGAFDESKLVTMQQLLDAVEEHREQDVILPMEIVAEGMQKIIIKDSAVDAVCNGAPLALQGIVRLESGIERGDCVALLTMKGQFVAFGNALMDSKGMADSPRGLAVKTDRVLMDRGTYPKTW